MRSWLAAALVLCGCRAVVTEAPDLLDASAPPDLYGADLLVVQPPPDLRCSSPIGPEDCNNGCDDDHNGFTDSDDPACTPTVIATVANGGTELDRLLFFSTPLARILDGNSVPAGAFATYDRKFANTIYLTFDTLPPVSIRTISFASGGVGTVTDITLPFATRDLCIFNNELVIVQRTTFGGIYALHRRPADAMADFPDGGVISLGTDLPTACASDGARLYVAVHDSVGNPSRFRVFDTTFTEGTELALPGALDPTLDRCLDFAWTSQGFFGLFVDSGGVLNDSTLSATQVTPFSLSDGGVGAPIDAGTLHGLGTFKP